MRTIVDHFEDELGPIAHGYSAQDNSGVQIIQFERGPMPGTRVLATLGLSHHTLALGSRGKTVRQELVMVFRENDARRRLPAVMHDVATSAIARHRGYSRGEVIGPRGPLPELPCYEALYVAPPVYFPDSFHVFESDGERPIVIAWLVPITHGEAHLVQRRGWQFFEDQLEAQDPDLLASDRAGVDVPFRE